MMMVLKMSMANWMVGTKGLVSDCRTALGEKLALKKLSIIETSLHHKHVELSPRMMELRRMRKDN